MKKCSYCGREYPDDATTCAIDGETLPGLTSDRKKVTGVWRGIYGYGKRDTLAGMKPVRFTLRLKQGWLSHFTGLVTEDAPDGIPAQGLLTVTLRRRRSSSRNKCRWDMFHSRTEAE